MIGNGQRAAGQVVISRPQMQQRFIGVAAHFPSQCGKRPDTRPVVAQLNRSGAGKFAQSFQKI